MKWPLDVQRFGRAGLIWAVSGWRWASPDSHSWHVCEVRWRGVAVRLHVSRMGMPHREGAVLDPRRWQTVYFAEAQFATEGFGHEVSAPYADTFAKAEAMIVGHVGRLVGALAPAGGGNGLGCPGSGQTMEGARTDNR